MRALEQLQAVIGVLVLVVVVTLYAQRAFGRARGKRRATYGNPLEVMDEVFAPARHVAAMELRTQQEQGPVTPVPDDYPKGLPSDQTIYSWRRQDRIDRGLQPGLSTAENAELAKARKQNAELPSLR